MEKRIIKNEILQELETDLVLHAKIAQAMNVHSITAQRWIQSNSPNLCHIDILDLIKRHKGWSDDKEITEIVNISPVHLRDN